MTALNSCEVLDELKKLGIEVNDDLLEYMDEYSVYYSNKDGKADTEAGN